jgi:hypothetical protein
VLEKRHPYQMQVNVINLKIAAQFENEFVKDKWWHTFFEF